MRCREVVSSLQERVFKGTRPLTLLVVGCVLYGLSSLTAPLGMSPSLIIVTFLFPFALIGIGPIPWQWTGDDAPKAGFLRGLLQALVISGIWLGLVMFTHKCFGPAKMTLGHFPSRAILDPDFGPYGFAIVMAIAFGRLLSEKEDTEAQKRSAEELLRESQRRALQSQLEPHVLYNALNSLAGLIQEDQEMAEEVVVRLADLYRMLAQQGEAAKIPLSEERRLVEAYLIMEQMRLGERLKIQWVWPDSEDQVMVPPLLLQPLVENAIKHGVSPSSQGGTVVITYRREGDAQMLQVANTGQAPDAEAPKGIGLGNLEARLALWCDVRGTLEFTRQDEWTLATVRWSPKELA